MLKALVIFPNQKTHDLGDLLAIARSCAKAREHSNETPSIRSIVYVAELGIHVAIYEAISHEKREENSHSHDANSAGACNTREEKARQ